MARVKSAHDGDLGELLTLLAQEAALPAGDVGIAFFFDYRGPSFNVAQHRDALAGIVRPLLRQAVSGRHCQAVFFSVDVVEHLPTRATVALNVAETPRPVTDTSVRVLMNTGNSQHAQQLECAEGCDELEAVRSRCEAMGGKLLAGSAVAEGRVIRVELPLPVERMQVDRTAAMEHGARIWLVGEPPVVFESVVRRLHRLGWTVQLLPSVQTAHERLAQCGAKRPDVVVGAERYNVSVPELVQLARGLAPAAAVYVTLLSTSPVQADALGFVENVQIYANPFSPAELYQMTVRALAKQDKVLRVADSSERALARRPRALLVEDNPLIQLLSTEILHLFGFEVDIAANGAEAVEYLSRELPSMVVMDINMPVMDGLEATRQIRELQRRGATPHVPILAATAQDDEETRRKAQEAGMDGFIPKPIDIGQMQREIARALNTSFFTLPEGEWQAPA